MKKNLTYFSIIGFVVIVLILTYFNIRMENVALVLVGFLILNIILMFEIKSVNSKDMAAISTLSALGAVSRVPFAAVPGLQPSTFIVAVSGYVLGPTNGFMVGAMVAFISNFFLGQGPWTMWQMLGWGLCGFFFGVLRYTGIGEKILTFTVFCGLWGFIFGIIQDMWYVIAFIKPFSIKSVVAGILSSAYFDTIHSIGNVVFSMIFGKKFISALERFNKRNKVEYLD